MVAHWWSNNHPASVYNHDASSDLGIFVIEGGAFVRRGSVDHLCRHLARCTDMTIVAPSYTLSQPKSRISSFVASTILGTFIARLFNFSVVGGINLVIVIALLRMVFTCVYAHSDVQHPAHIQDIAHALAWAQQKFGWRGVHIIGHSAGGHLAALLCTNIRFIRGVGIDPSFIVSCTAMNGLYSFRRTLAVPFGYKFLSYVFGITATHTVSDDTQCDIDDDTCIGSRMQSWLIRDAWPIYHSNGDNIPPMLLITSGLDSSLKMHAKTFSTALQENGNSAPWAHFGDTTHFSVKNYWHSKNRSVSNLVVNFILLHS